MKQGAFCLLTILLCLAAGKAGAQIITDSTVQRSNSTHIQQRIVIQAPVSITLAPVFTSNNFLNGGAALPSTLPSNLYATQLGFFCTKELQVEKALKMPLKFRLGSVQYTDQLEGKNKGN